MRHEVFVKTSNGRRSVLLSDDFCQSLSVPVGENKDSVLLFIASWISLLADSPLESEKKPYTLYNDFLSKIKEKGIKALVTDYSSLAHRFVSQHTLMGPPSSIGEWIDDFKDTPVFFEYNRYYKTGDVKLLEYIYTFLNFGKKLEYVDETFNKVAFRDWLDIEKRLGDLHLRSDDTLVLNRILATLLPRFTWTDLRPKFGPGRVQERGVMGRIAKIRTLAYDHLIDRFLLRGHIGMYGMGEDFGVSKDKVIPDPTQWDPAKGISSRSARLRFVPKNLKTSRSICMEPNTLMYFQQAVMRQFLELIGDSFLCRFIDIKDQSKNQKLAWEGSFTSEVDTLDLSAASDRMSFELIKLVFPPSWLIPMIATRSNKVILPDDSERVILKFAPMGSALCFPTQCIIFASVCIYAACLHTYEVEKRRKPFLDWLTPSVIRRVTNKFGDSVRYRIEGYQPLAVYGDDICVDRKLTDIVTSILDRLGFVTNKEKSFTGSQAFRESCGKYYLNGHDITPLFFTVEGVKPTLRASHVVSQVHLINEAYKRGYKNLYRFLRHTLMTWGSKPSLRNRFGKQNPIPYVSDPDQFGILSIEPKNNHLESRENSDLQRTEYRCWTISYDYKVKPGDDISSVDAYEYMRWWVGRAMIDTSDFKESVSRSDTGGARIKWRWIPLI